MLVDESSRQKQTPDSLDATDLSSIRLPRLLVRFHVPRARRGDGYILWCTSMGRALIGSRCTSRAGKRCSPTALLLQQTFPAYRCLLPSHLAVHPFAIGRLSLYLRRPRFDPWTNRLLSFPSSLCGPPFLCLNQTPLQLSPPLEVLHHLFLLDHLDQPLRTHHTLRTPLPVRFQRILPTPTHLIRISSTSPPFHPSSCRQPHRRSTHRTPSILYRNRKTRHPSDLLNK
mmetsp:Transcript_6366/g.12684  ORF Transcript_6366/g.12684 Transcript_6366/m.12684 type:complete len:228 (+) Transcript_6366:3505-4188(+)